MTAPLLIPGFDGLMTLSRREGVDIRPTLLRVLTDLYVQARSHTVDEERQFVELVSRLIDQVDDTTRAAVRARLSIYPSTPMPIAYKLGLRQPDPEQLPLAGPIETASPSLVPSSRAHNEAAHRIASQLTMQPDDAAQINDMFLAAGPSERAQILHNLAEAPLRPAARVYGARAELAVKALEMAAYAVDPENFARELSEVLILPLSVSERIVQDEGGEPMACAVKALGMPGPMFERVLMFLDPTLGASVNRVYRLSRLYDNLSERAALIMLAAWRGNAVAVTRAKYRPTLYDDERQRARGAAASPARPAVQPGQVAARNVNQR
jgi:hypothetical protein